YDAYYIKAQQIRRLIKQDFDRAFADVDVIIGPTTPHAAFRVGEKNDDPVTMYLEDIYTIAVNLAGLPGVSIPVGTSAGLPVGMQIVANDFAEARLLNVAHQFQQHTDWHTRRASQDGLASAMMEGAKKGDAGDAGKGGAGSEATRGQAGGET